MFKMLKIMVAVVAIFLVAGCKMNLAADVYTTDLRDVMAGTPGLTSPATLAIQIPSKEKCAEHAAEISEIMGGVIDSFSPKGCEDIRMDSFLLADIQLPISGSESAWRESNSLFGIVTVAQENDIGAVVVMDLEKYEILEKRMKEKFHQSLDLSGSRLALVLNNDERKSAEYSVEGVFLNNEPVLEMTTYELKRRQKAEIKFSNVATAHMVKRGIAGGFVLKGVALVQ